jgi:hypothetical protein
MNIKLFFTQLLYGKWVTIKVIDGYWVDEQNRPVSHVAYLIQANLRTKTLRLELEGNNPKQHVTYVTALKVMGQANAKLYNIHLPDVYNDNGKRYSKKIGDLLLSLEAELSQYVEKELYEDANNVKYYLDNIKQLVNSPAIQLPASNSEEPHHKG